MSSTPRRNDDGTRTGFGSLAAGGLRWDSLPLKLFLGGNAKFWNPADLDFSQDARDWAERSEDDRFLSLLLCALFIAGEEAVTEDIRPFAKAMQAEGRLGDELYLTQFAFEEAKHTAAFRMWLDAVGETGDLHPYVEHSTGYKRIFYEELPTRLQAVGEDPSPEHQIRASVTYNHVVEGMLALTGYHVWNRICRAQRVLPGMQQLVQRIGDDERRHMAWGTFTCRRHVAADDRLWAVVEDQFARLMEPALDVVTSPYAAFPERFEGVTFQIPQEEMAAYALDRLNRRLGAIASARGRPLAEIDVDTEPVDLEDRFGDEDAQLLEAAGS